MRDKIKIAVNKKQNPIFKKQTTTKTKYTMAKCISPITLKKQEIAVPCGRCLPCMKNRASNWSFRLTQEAKICTSAYFITLTYDTDNVPLTNNGFMTLDKRDFQLFMKRLRKQNTNQLKYYCVGEYGGLLNRPHFHAIMYNLDLDTFIDPKIARQIHKGIIPMDGKTPIESKIWQNGHITIGKVTEASIGYTLIYISKGREVPKHSRDDRQKEFSLMSKRIGSNYLTPKIKKWHLADLTQRYYVNINTTTGISKAPMPRYYKEKLYTKWQITKIAYHLEQQALTEYQALTPQQQTEHYEQLHSKAQRLQYKKDYKK